jgi:hypothetical protein
MNIFEFIIATILLLALYWKRLLNKEKIKNL